MGVDEPTGVFVPDFCCEVLVLRRRGGLLGGFGGTYLSAVEGCKTKFISCFPSADQRSTVTKKKETSTSLRFRL